MWQPLGLPVQRAAHRAGVPVVHSLRGARGPYGLGRGWWKKWPYFLLRERPLLQLGDDLVGKDPRQVQELLLEVHTLFLQGLDGNAAAPVGVLRQGNVRAWLLDRAGAARLRLRN